MRVVLNKVKLNTIFLESLTLRNWGYSRCLEKHSEKKEDKNKLNSKKPAITKYDYLKMKLI